MKSEIKITTKQGCICPHCGKIIYNKKHLGDHIATIHSGSGQDSLIKQEKSEEIRMKKGKVDERFKKVLVPIEARERDLIKKHEILETSAEDYAEIVRQLSETARKLIADGRPESEAIRIRIGQVDKSYAGLRDLGAERSAKLDDALKLPMLNREVDDLEQWIVGQEVVAGSHEFGQDYEHITLCVERSKELGKEPDAIGSERVAAVNEIADSLISVGHADAATTAQWKDSLNDVWSDLGQLIDTRKQMLEASRASQIFP